MADEIVKQEQGLVAIVRQAADDAIKAAETAEKVKYMPFVEAEMSISRVVMGMATTLIAGLTGEFEYKEYANNSITYDLFASPTGKLSLVCRKGGYGDIVLGLSINTKKNEVRMKPSNALLYSPIEKALKKLEGAFTGGDCEVVRIFKCYSQLPVFLANATKQARKSAEERMALIENAMQVREAPEIIISVEDPLEEKFRMLEAGEAKWQEK